MRLYRLGDEGEPVRDIQDRLASLGHECSGDPVGTFGQCTLQAAKSFQEKRGIHIDGIVGPETWRSLYEAGYRLGDRILFLRRPMFRGDDVTELQHRLDNLGFDAGKPDGIFGVDTHVAVMDFQQNRGLASDGVAGPEVIVELRLVSRRRTETGREHLREQEWLRSLRPTVVGTRVYFDPSARSPAEATQTWALATAASIELQERGGLPVISRSVDSAFPDRVRAQRANRLGADVIVSLQIASSPPEAGVFYFRTDRSRSEAGRRLATIVATSLDLPCRGRATAMLRETRAPAVVISGVRLGEELGVRTVDAIEEFFRVGGLDPVEHAAAHSNDPALVGPQEKKRL